MQTRQSRPVIGPRSGNDGENGALIYEVHVLDTIGHVVCIVLDKAEAVNPEISLPDPQHHRHGVLDCPRDALLEPMLTQEPILKGRLRLRGQEDRLSSAPL